MQFLPNAPYNAANTSTRDTHKWDPRKIVPKTKPCGWCELGDVVSRRLPHRILGTSEDTQVGDFPHKYGLVCAWTFLYLSRSVGGAWGVRFRREPTSLTLLRCKYERKLFLNPKNYVLNPGNYFLNPRNYFFNPGHYFFNPGNYCLT